MGRRGGDALGGIGRHLAYQAPHTPRERRLVYQAPLKLQGTPLGVPGATHYQGTPLDIPSATHCQRTSLGVMGATHFQGTSLGVPDATQRQRTPLERQGTPLDVHRRHTTPADARPCPATCRDVTRRLVTTSDTAKLMRLFSQDN